MIPRPFLYPAFLISLSLTPAAAQEGVVDLTALANYAAQSLPPYITKNNTPGSNAITDAGATLGRILFYDKRLSRNDTVSCASCHQQALAFADTATASAGVSGTTGRHSMRLINARFATEARFFWDERATSLENQTSQPIKDHIEMGFSGSSGDPSFSDLVTKLSAIPEYRVLFAMTFADKVITETRIQRALSQFVRSIQSFDSKYDAGRALVNDNQPFPNFTASENAGKQLFLTPPGPGGGAGCAGCHRPPEFDIDPNSRNNGVTTGFSGTDLTNTRAPTLRDLVGPGGQSNGAFMHDASFATLDQVISHYNQIPADNANLDNRLRRPGGGLQNLNLSPQQRADLVTFLRTLTGTAVYSDVRWSDPFDSSGVLQLIVLPQSAMTIQPNSDGSATLTCHASPGLPYALQSSPNLRDWDPVTTVTPDTNGTLQTSVPGGTTLFYRFTYSVPAP